jgi:aminocarboxymuconate-semialdehyde decarboxylase
MRIDAHAHLWSENYLDLLAKAGKGDTAVQRIPSSYGTDEAIEARLRLMDSVGVDLQVLSVTPQSPHFPDEAMSVSLARFVNDEYADLVHGRPARFAAFAALPLPHIDAALAELARAMDELGMVGAALTADILGTSAADHRFDPIFAELDRRAATLFVHPAGSSIGSKLLEDAGLTWPIGAPIEDTVVATELIRLAVPVRYPNLKIIVAHLGGALPMLLGRLDNSVRFFNGESAEQPSSIARRMWYDTVGHNYPPALRAAVDAFGAEKLSLGSDFPYLDGDLYRGAVTHISASGLAEGAAERILDQNAARIIGKQD